MGEVGANSTDSPSAETKMNGGLNGKCDDEPMEVDSHDDSHAEIQLVKKSDTENVSNDSETAVSTKSAENTVNSDQDADASAANKQNGGDSVESGKTEKPEEDDQTSNIVDQITIERPTVTSDSATTQLVNNESVKNGVSSVRLNNGGSAELDDDDADIDGQVHDENEVHSISDSDDDEPAKPLDHTNSLGGTGEAMELVVNRTANGAASTINHNTDDEYDDDKPVSIHSDSDDDEVAATNNRNNGNNNANSAEVHEILSDKEDCVVIEDDGKDGDNQQSQRPANRSRKSAVKPRDYSVFDDDIEEIIEDPLQQPAAKKPRINLASQLGSQITIRDARSLATDPLVMGKSGFQQQYVQANNKSNEPTLVIIDTNDILARAPHNTTTPQMQALQKQNVSVMPVGSSHNQSATSYTIHSRASITPVLPNQSPVGISPTIPLALPSFNNTDLLPALSDDMFVLEAPSFIVPYIYEKPPADSLRSIVDKIGIDLKEQRQKEDEERKKQEQEAATEKEAKDKDKEASLAIGDSKKKEDKKKKKIAKSGDESWDESDESTDDEASDSEERTKVLIKEAKHDLTSIIHSPGSTLATDPEKKDINNYFESPLGLFFMDIGINLVQEHVQTDLLRQQKKKLHREGAQASPAIQLAINALMKNLETSKGHNDVFKFSNKRCEFCNFKSESSLVMANHYETPHMKNNHYKCNFCEYEVRAPYDILFHMKSVHNIQARLEKALSYHQCPNCAFEDNGRSKLARHSVVCAKKFKPEINLCPPLDWEPPAKIPRIKPRHGLVGTANAYQAMAAQAQRAAAAAAIQKQQQQIQTPAMNAAKNRGRPQTITKPSPAGTVLRTNQAIPAQISPGGMVLPNNFAMNNAAQYIQIAGAGLALLPNAHKPFIVQNASVAAAAAAAAAKTNKVSQTPSISITALPRQQNNVNNMIPNNSRMSNATATTSAALPKPPNMANIKPGQSPQGNKTAFVICEICDGYIKDLDQLRNHMQWMHKVKIHPKMIYNRPPLNCQKCQFRFFTDQGLERHLLGSHGLVTSSMQDAANKSKDAGRCPVCGRMYQWKLLNHVSREHGMTLKPAHLSYKCTVCTATFGMYKQFENHVYSAHSTVSKKSMGNKNNTPTKPSGVSAGDSLLKPLKINDEITIIPQPARNIRPTEIESHVID